MDDRSRNVLGGLDRFFRGVGRSVVAGQGVDRQQQAKQEQAEDRCGFRPDIASCRPGIVRESPQPAEIMARRVEEQDQGEQHRSAQDQVARKVGQSGGGPDPQVVDQRMAGGHQSDDQHLGGIAVFYPQAWPERADQEIVGADIDCRKHRDQPQQVHPGGKPAPEPAAQDRAPVIKPAGSRVGRSDLCHAKREQ